MRPAAGAKPVNAHVNLLGILQVAWGVIGLLLGISTLMLAAGAVMIGLSAQGQAIQAIVTAAAFAVCAATLLAFGLGNAWSGAAIRRYQPAGRLAALVLAVPNLFVLPFGTALGIYSMWVLLHDETRRKFIDGQH